MERVTVETEKVMQSIASAIDQTLNEDIKNPDYGFVVLVYPFNNEGGETLVNFVSNSKREQVIEAMKEIIVRAESSTH